MTDDRPEITRLELQLAARNHGMPLEALRYERTPVGLHYLLVHYDIPVVDLHAWRLTVSGTHSLELGIDELRARPVLTTESTMECAGNGRALLDPRPLSQPWLVEAVGNAAWTGTPLRPLLEESGVPDGTLEVLFTGLDRGVEGGVEQNYERSLPLAEALSDDVLLAYDVNGAALPPQHGFPLRLLVPGWYGMTNVKWLHRITFLDGPHTGYQNARAYRYRAHEDDPGTPVTRMAPRALMVPPGLPDFLTRRRFVAPEPVELTGRAWSGFAPIASVEVSDDGGRTWTYAELGPRRGRWAWRSWTYTWTPRGPGDHELRCRAADAEGSVQPDDAPWNAGGYANNAAQRVEVTVA